jgi:hypothetical protein
VPDLTGPDALREPAPLTYEQEWYLANTRGSSRAQKNVRLSYEILGPLDAELLAEAVRRFVARHDALRMTLIPQGDPAVADPGAAGGDRPAAQRALPARPGDRPLTVEHVTAASARQFSRYASAVLSRDVLTPLIGRDRPFTVRLLRYGPEHHAFLATFANLFFDGRAHDLFAREVWRDYAALRDEGTAPPLVATSFAEAARRQRASHGPRHLERARASWHRRLEFAARNRWREPGGIRSTPSGTVHAEIPAAEVEALRAFCRGAQCTVTQWLVGSFVGALARCAGQRRVSLWTSVDSRRTAEREVVGMFAGPAPIAIGAPAATLPDVVAEVGTAMVDALRHQQLSARELARLLDDAGTEAGPLPRDVYVNLRTFPGSLHGADAGDGPRITADAYPLRRISFQESAALHLRCNEYRDAIVIDLVFDGRRVGGPLARTIADRIVADATGVRATGVRRPPAPGKALP